MVILRKAIIYLLVVPLVSLLIPTGARAQEGCIAPTIPAEVTYPPGWNCECNGDTPDAYSMSDRVSRGTHTTVWVDSNGLACPPYEWSLVEPGFTSLALPDPPQVEQTLI